LFLFVPETFWDRAPTPHRRKQRSRSLSNLNILHHRSQPERKADASEPTAQADVSEKVATKHAHFGPEEDISEKSDESGSSADVFGDDKKMGNVAHDEKVAHADSVNDRSEVITTANLSVPEQPATPRSPSVLSARSFPVSHEDPSDAERQSQRSVSPGLNGYTKSLREAPTRSLRQQLKVWNGRICNDRWWRVAVRPFFLFTYPSIMWSALIYAMSIGWLIVLSESVGHIYEDRDTYNFTPLQVGLVYISPFIGGIIGTAIAGKVSDIIVRYMARKNGGIYEPEFRLVMAIPIAISTVAGLMGFGWSVEERDNWIVPTVFFGIISFGCSLGSTTSITFAVDSYRQYAGEALVTLNVSKNILHGLVWSLFFNRWLEKDGSRLVFNCIGGIQLACLLTTIPMYIWGKRGRMWTVRRNLMEKF
jgi:hypothetical protein